MQPFFVYIVRCSDGSLYTGHTDDLERRITQHQLGVPWGYTSRRRPVTLVYSCEFTPFAKRSGVLRLRRRPLRGRKAHSEFITRVEALEREIQIKGWSRAKKQALIRGDFELLRALSRPSTAGSRCEPSAQGERLGLFVRP
ncbi:MAG TPA: GIY-YIG nuclease family protein [Candidatus Binatia bacterium]|nr:GIY-YIG nuclease family protein [Candidatus Binatia bacterium]